MKRITAISFISILALILSYNTSFAELDIGLKIDNDGVKSFHVAIGEHYNVPEKEVIVYKQNALDNLIGPAFCLGLFEQSIHHPLLIFFHDHEIDFC